MYPAWQVIGLIQKDARLILRRPQAAVVLLILPLVLMAVTGPALDFVLGETSLRVTIVDLDRSERSAQLLEELGGVTGLEARRAERPGASFDEPDVRDLLDGGAAVLLIPKGYSGADGPSLRYYVDPLQAGLATVIQGRIEQAAFLTELPSAVAGSDAAGQDAVRRAVASAIEAPAVRVEDSLGTEAQGFPSAFEQSVPGFAVMFGFWMAGYFAVVLYSERELWGTWRRTLASPVPRWSMPGTKIAAYAVFGVLQLAVLFTAGRVIWGVDLGQAPVTLAFIMAAASFVTVCFGWVVTSLVREYLAQQSIISLSVFTLGAIGGAFVPVFLLPPWMEWLSPFTPQYWAITAFQDAMFRGAGLADVTLNIGVLLAFSAALFFAGLARFRLVP